MKLHQHLAPHIRSGSSNLTVMGDAVITLGAIYIMAYFYYGQRAITLGLTSVAVSVAADVFCCLLRRKKVTVMDLSAVVTGMLIPLLLPATVSYKIVVLTALFAICVVKQPFGGVGSNLFNPAAGGFAFAIVCWSKELFLYPIPFSTLPVYGEITVPLYSSTAYTLYVGGIPQISHTNLMLGMAPGPMGTTNILVLAACVVYLVLRRTVRFQQPLLMLAAVAAVAWLFPRADVAPLTSVFYELTAAPTLFFAAFLFGDPVTTPARGVTKAFYAIVGGIVLMAFRHAGGYEFTEPFALLLMNALTPAFDAAGERVNTIVRRMAFETVRDEEQQTIADDEEDENAGNLPSR